jgi:hypothetical protein
LVGEREKLSEKINVLWLTVTIVFFFVPVSVLVVCMLRCLCVILCTACVLHSGSTQLGNAGRHKSVLLRAKLRICINFPIFQITHTSWAIFVFLWSLASNPQHFEGSYLWIGTGTYRHFSKFHFKAS